MKLRTYRKSDSPVITGWIKDEKALFQWSSDRFGAFPLKPDALNENYEPQLAAGNFYPLTMTDDSEKIAGHMIIRYPDSSDKSTVRFGFVIVNPEIRGKGYGKQMIQLALDFSRNELKAERVTMGAFANNPSAWNCYEKAGFVRTGTEIYHLKTGDWECIEMEYTFNEKNKGTAEQNNTKNIETDIEKLKPVLETERLIIRPIMPDDYLDAFEWCGDPVVNKFMLYSLYKNAEDVRKWIESINHSNPDSYEYCFVEKATGKAIGSGGLYYHEDIDVWAVGYNLRHDRWNKGYVTEAEKAIIEHVKSVRNVREIQGQFAVDNPGSGRVMEKLGMSFLQDTEYTKWDGSATFKAKIYSSLGEKGTKHLPV